MAVQQWMVTESRERREEGRTEDAYASEGEEGRAKLRKLPVSRKEALTRWCPNGATRQAEGLSPTKVGANVGN